MAGADPRIVREGASLLTGDMFKLSPALVLRIVRAFNQFSTAEQTRVERIARRDMVLTEKRRHEGKTPFDPTAERQAKGPIVEGETYLQGSEARTEKTRRAQDSLDRLLARRDITKRQYTAADRYRQDWEVGIVGARQPIGATNMLTRGSAPWPRALAFSEVQIEAGNSWAKATKAMGEHKSVVRAVACLGLDVQSLARPRDKKDDGTVKSSVKLRLMWQLRRGLDLLADCHNMVSNEVVQEDVVVDESDDKSPVVNIVYRFMPGDRGMRVMGILYQNQPWIGVEAPSEGALRDLARRRARRKTK